MMARHNINDSLMSLNYGDSHSCSMLSLTSINSSTMKEASKFDFKDFIFCLTKKSMINDRALMAAIQFLRPEYMIAETTDDLIFYSEEEKHRFFFVCDIFSGDIFDLLRKKQCRICGPQLLLYIHERKRPVPETHRPLFNGSMFGVKVCFTSFDTVDAVTQLANLVHFMGGSVRKGVCGKLTHVVARAAQGHNYKAAVNLGKHIMTEKWITKAWENRLEQNFKATRTKFIEQFQMKPFHGLKLSFLGFAPKDEEHMRELTVENGGSYYAVGSESITHLVVEDINSPTLPEVQAVHVVKQEWFWTSIQLDACAEESLYYYVSANGTPVSSAPRRKRKNLPNAYDLFSPNSPGHRPSKRKSNDRISAISSSLYDESMGSPFSDLGSPEVSINKKVPLTSRNQTCLELQQTEKNYVEVLRTIIKVFKEPLEKSGDLRGGALLPHEDIKTIFGTIPDLLEVHENLLSSVNKLIDNWNEEQLIGKTVVDCADGMIKSYPNFVNYFDMIKETIAKCEKEKPRFHAFLKVCLTKPECGRQTLTELLIRPVQRLPSMSLLFNDILKHTPETNPDHSYLKEAVAAIKKVLTFINEDRRKTEHQFQMFETVGGIDNCPAYILSAHRTLVSKAEVQQVMEGLIIECDHMQMFLFNDSIEIAKKRNRGGGNPVPGKSPALIPRVTQVKPYKHKEFIKLSHLQSVVDINDEGDYKDMFGLVYYSDLMSKDTLSIFKMISSSPKKEWMNQILKCLSETKCTTDMENFLVSVDASELCTDKHNISQGKERSGTIAKLFEKTKSKFSTKGIRNFALKRTPKQQSNKTLRRVMSSVTPTNLNYQMAMSPGTPRTPISPSPSEYSILEMSVCEETN